MKIKTSSGFECDIDERKAKDIRLQDAIMSYVPLEEKENKSEEEKLKAVTLLHKIFDFILDEDVKEALGKHIEDEDGFRDSEKFYKEFGEIFKKIIQGNSTVKKSSPSPD